MPRSLDPKQLGQLEYLALPLPSSRMALENDNPRLALVEAVLQAEGITLEQLRLKGLKELFFSRGDRAAWVRPADIDAAAEPDELNAGKQKLTMAFELPRGSYATLIVKRLQYG